jgi:hypothetical protein
MGVATEDGENAEEAEEQAFSWNIGNKLRLTCWANTSDGTASNRILSASAFSAYSVCSAVISIAAFRLKRAPGQLKRTPSQLKRAPDQLKRAPSQV